MSFYAVLWASKQDLQPIPKLILVSLATFASKNDGSCYPKIATIAKMASVSPRTVFRRLPELTQSKLVRIELNFDGKARRPHTYWLACGGDGGSSVGTTRIDRRGPDNSGRANNHHSNHHTDSEMKVPQVGRAPLAWQGSGQAKIVRSTTSTVEQEAGNELARRLGEDGWLILMEFPEEIAQLSALLRKRALTDSALADLRLRFAQRQRSGAEHEA